MWMSYLPYFWYDDDARTVAGNFVLFFLIFLIVAILRRKSGDRD